MNEQLWIELGNFNDQFHHPENLNLLGQAHKFNALGLLVIELVRRVERTGLQVESLQHESRLYDRN